jgi:membrane-associated protease RseP (regulator of RpoE activity)
LQEDFKRFTFTYGLVMFRTRKGLSIMDSLGKRKITKPLAWIMLYLLPISGGLALFLILSEFFVYLSPRGVAVANYVVSNISPTGNLLIPGLNPYVPIVYGWIAIVVAVVIHEAAHGIVARSLGMRVKTAGVLFLLFIPIGAFVEVDEKEMKEVKPSMALRVLGAGSGINFIVGLLCLLLLALTVGSMTPLANGSAIASVSVPSPAATAGIVPGDFITAINGVSNNDLGTLGLSPYQVINITIWHDGKTEVLQNVELGIVWDNNTQTHQNTSAPYLGVGYLTYGTLKGFVSSYVNPQNEAPVKWVLYIVPPSFPGISVPVPFSPQLNVFYTSPLGGATNDLQNLLFWVFFVNFNLAIFNNLPIYPMDGGQALERFIVAVGRGKIDDAAASRLATAVTVLLIVILVSVIAGPYLYVYLT